MDDDYLNWNSGSLQLVLSSSILGKCVVRNKILLKYLQFFKEKGNLNGFFVYCVISYG